MPLKQKDEGAYGNIPPARWPINYTNKLSEKERSKINFTDLNNGIFSHAAWEIAYLMKKMEVVPQIASLPLCKMLVWCDTFLKNSNLNNGNNITVI